MNHRHHINPDPGINEGEKPLMMFEQYPEETGPGSAVIVAYAFVALAAAPFWLFVGWWIWA